MFIAIIGFIAAAICGYMAGLVGSSNSPVSGVGILVVVIAALSIKATFGAADDAQALALMALTLIATAVTFCAATIANDNLQDLKTGQLVGATPWKQQNRADHRRRVRVGGHSASAQPHADRIRLHRRAGAGDKGAGEKPPGGAHLTAGQRRPGRFPELDAAGESEP